MGTVIFDSAKEANSFPWVFRDATGDGTYRWKVFGRVVSANSVWVKRFTDFLRDLRDQNGDPVKFTVTYQ